MKVNSFYTRYLPSSIKKVLFAFFFFAAWSTSVLMADNPTNDYLGAVNDIKQDKIEVHGVVKDATGEPLIGVSVAVVGTTVGTVTDFDGNFSLSVPNSNSVLDFSYVGFAKQNIKVGSKTSFNVVLKEDSHAIDEVVVTALGIKRQKRSLGYSTTDVKGDQFTESRDINIGNALTGKVAGVSVGNNATGVGGSSRVIIRGTSSISGNNQPLYVVDGVPFDNSNQGSAGQYGGLDLGDGLSNISADDIADIQVLKGAAASALYGYRGGNGAILITTKSGKKGKPISIELNNNLTFNTIYDYRNYQKVYGLGVDGKAPSSIEEARQNATSSWGARMEGQDATNFLGNTYRYAYKNNWNDFYRTGITNSTSLAFSGSSENVTYRFGVSNLADRGILPNSSMSQQGLNLNTTYDITKKLHLTVTGNYTFDKSHGRAGLSDGNGNANASLLYLGNSFDVRWLEREDPTAKWGSTSDGKELGASNNIYFNNPYWLQYRKTNNINRNRLVGGATLRYDIFDWLYAQGAVTRDGYSFDFKQVQPRGALADATGFVTEYSKNYSEMNLNYLLGFNKQFSDWSVGATFGGNAQRNIVKQWGTEAKGFIIDGVDSPNNTITRPMNKIYQEYRVNSIYGTADIGYKNQVFLNLTGRNDWFSTLSKSSNHYFYPSATMSWVFTDTFSDKPDWFSFGKVRLGYASSSNGTEAYRNLLYYENQSYTFNSQIIFNAKGDVIPNKDLKPVKISEWETGFNLAFLDNRLNFDFSLYYKKTKDDILKVGVSSASGYSYQMKNLGEMRNRGLELLVSGVPIRTKDFIWNSSFNIAINDNKILSLGGQSSIVLDGGIANGGGVAVHVVEGKSYGQIYGYKYLRNNEGKIIYKDGLPQRTTEREYFGSGVYKTTGGWRNDFSYKNWSLAFLLDFKLGAKMYSGTNANLTANGLHKQTLQGRENNPATDRIIGDGVMLDASGNYVPNTEGVKAYDYWTSITSNGTIAEEFVYNASFLKLRELSLGYTLPKSLFQNQSVVKSVTLSFVARNIWTIIKHTDNIDPESGYSNSNAQGLELNGYPTTRSFGFNVNVKF